MPSGDSGGTLYGRKQQVADLLGIQASVIIIGGDRGVGKTRVLEETGRLFEGLAPAPVRVGNAPAALQAAAALIASDEGSAHRIGKLLVEGGRRLARAKANEIGVAVARIVLRVIRDRVGSNVTDVLSEYFEQVRDAATDDLASRIRQARRIRAPAATELLEMQRVSGSLLLDRLRDAFAVCDRWDLAAFL
jgi:hypothetical protein